MTVRKGVMGGEHHTVQRGTQHLGREELQGRLGRGTFVLTGIILQRSMLSNRNWL